jgi:hypothetical protein
MKWITHSLHRLTGANSNVDGRIGRLNVIGKCRAAAVFIRLADAEFWMTTDIERTGLTKGLKETVEKDLGLPLFVARNVALRPRRKFSEFFLARHGWFLHEEQRSPQC